MSGIFTDCLIFADWLAEHGQEQAGNALLPAATVAREEEIEAE